MERPVGAGKNGGPGRALLPMVGRTLRGTHRYWQPSEMMDGETEMDAARRGAVGAGLRLERSRVGRRSVVAAGLAAAVAGCQFRASSLGIGHDPELGTAVIGLRIQDSAALQAVRSTYHWTVPVLPFMRRDPEASLAFGRIDPASGGIYLPRSGRLQGLIAGIDTGGYETDFESFQLVPGRYVTLYAWFNEQPNQHTNYIRVLKFSGDRKTAEPATYGSYMDFGTREFLSAGPAELGGYEFTIARGETVYVGTLVLALAQSGANQYGYAPPRIEDEFAAASSAYPALAAVGQVRATRLMTPYGEPRAVPATPPPSPRAPSPAPRAPLPSGRAHIPRVG